MLTLTSKTLVIQPTSKNPQIKGLFKFTVVAPANESNNKVADI